MAFRHSSIAAAVGLERRLYSGIVEVIVSMHMISPRTICCSRARLEVGFVPETRVTLARLFPPSSASRLHRFVSVFLRRGLGSRGNLFGEGQAPTRPRQVRACCARLCIVDCSPPPRTSVAEHGQVLAYLTWVADSSGLAARFGFIDDAISEWGRAARRAVLSFLLAQILLTLLLASTSKRQAVCRKRCRRFPVKQVPVVVGPG